MIASIGIISCASPSKEIAAVYVSPIQYEQFSCDQLSQELERLNRKKNSLATSLDEKASNDKGLTAVSVILFWPAAFALGGNQAQEAEYAQLKGRYDAVQQAGVEKSCNLETTRAQLTTVANQSSLGKLNAVTSYYGYGQAEEEIVSGTYNKDLWAKALVDAEGDETKRKFKYIELRATQLYSEKAGVIEGTLSKSDDLSKDWVSKIPSIKGGLKEFKLFTYKNKDKKKFANKFSDFADYIYWYAGIEFPITNQNLELKIDTVWSKQPSGKVIANDSFKLKIESGLSHRTFWRGWGSYAGGWWKRGNYKVSVSINGEMVGEQLFKVN